MRDYPKYFDEEGDYSSRGTCEQANTWEDSDFRIEACAPIMPTLDHVFFNLNLVDQYRLQRNDNLLDELFERVGSN